MIIQVVIDIEASELNQPPLFEVDVLVSKEERALLDVELDPELPFSVSLIVCIMELELEFALLSIIIKIYILFFIIYSHF
jgi:hypothetical protein